MALMIPDQVLESTGLNEEQARIEIACRLFDAGKLTLGAAIRWTGLRRGEFEDELLDRGISDLSADA